MLEPWPAKKAESLYLKSFKAAAKAATTEA